MQTPRRHQDGARITLRGRKLSRIIGRQRPFIDKVRNIVNLLGRHSLFTEVVTDAFSITDKSLTILVVLERIITT